jgi:hypothetical protein
MPVKDACIAPLDRGRARVVRVLRVRRPRHEYRLPSHRPAGRVRRTPDTGQSRCSAEDARHVPASDLSDCNKKEIIQLLHRRGRAATVVPRSQAPLRS